MSTAQTSGRVEAFVAAFNEGRIDRVLDGFAHDVEVAIPLYRVGEEVGPSTWRDREHLRRLLLDRYEAGSRIELVQISVDEETSAVVVIKSSRQGQLTVTFHFDDQGLASRLVVFKQ